MRILSSLALAFVAVALSAACDKKSSDSGSTESASADPAAAPLPKIDYAKKPPGKGTRPVSQKAVKGGSGDKRPSANSVKMDEASTDRQMRKRATADVVDCKALPDNSAECDGTNLYFCDDSRLWVVDCDAEAKFAGVASGACFEGEHFTNCLGCGAADDGTQECCDFELTVCCNDQGDCYNPKG